MSRQSKFNEEEIKRMYNEYLAGSSSVVLSNKYNSSAGTIVSLFKNRGYLDGDGCISICKK